jgi:putative endonuclease
MEEFVVYILYSLSNSTKTYVGYTSNLIQRMKEHNHTENYPNAFTKKFRPWMVVYLEFFDNKSDALKREKWFKTGVGRDFIKANLEHWLEHSPPRRT